MPARKQPRRIEHRPGVFYIKPGLGERGGIEIITDLQRAKREAEDEANRYDQHRYVIRWEDGYVVMGYADIWDYFGDAMKDETVYTVNAPGSSKGKKWPGEQ